MSHPTPYPGVNAVLHRLLTDVQAILGDQLVGMYLYGSLSSGDFDPQRSDIDFLVVTAGKLPDETAPALEAMHKRLWASGLKWEKKLEGSYLPLADLRRFDPNADPVPQVNEGRFYVAQQGSDWIIQRYILRESGVVLFGPDLRPLIDPVSADDIRRAVLGILREWWFPMLENPGFLRDLEYQAYGILSMCRALHALEHGTIVSKPVAARWAQQALGDRWTEPIERALTWQHGEPEMLNEALELIEYVRERTQSV